MTNGRHPDAIWAPSPNFTPGHGERLASVIHIAEGGARGSMSWLRNPASGVSSHFFLTLRGELYQHVSLNDTAHTNGLTWLPRTKKWLAPSGKIVKPTWPLIVPGVNPNLNTVTIEHEGFHGDRWPVAMEQASAQLLQWLSLQLDLEWVASQTLIGHYHINPIDKANCPGPHVDLERLAKLGTVPPATAAAKRYVVSVRKGAVVRAETSIHSNRLGALALGAEVIGKEVIGGDRPDEIWVKRTNFGYIRRDLLTPAGE